MTIAPIKSELIKKHGIDVTKIPHPDEGKLPVRDMTPKELIASLDWQPPNYIRKRKEGEKDKFQHLYVQKAPIPEPFWSLWKIKKDEIKALGIYHP